MIETESLVFTDVYTKVDGSHVGEFRREFEEIGTTSTERLIDPTGEEFEDDMSGSSELEDATVVFRWDVEAEEYVASLGEDSQDVDVSLLEELDAVADLTWFLPEEDLEEGDTWEIDIDAFRHLSALSGELSIIREGEEDEPEDDSSDQFDENLSGEMVGEFIALREEEGLRLAVLHITAELETSVEVTEEFEEDGGHGSVVDTYEFSFELEGELLWDVDAGHAHSLELRGDCVMSTTSEQEFTGDGHEISFTKLQEFEGSVEFQINVE